MSTPESEEPLAVVATWLVIAIALLLIAVALGVAGLIIGGLIKWWRVWVLAMLATGGIA